LEVDPETDLLASEPFDWLDIEEMPETDLFSEKHEEMGVGRRFGEEEVELSLAEVATSRSVDIGGHDGNRGAN
jgi:hypothetical protein